jgi:hypothetical protein
MVKKMMDEADKSFDKNVQILHKFAYWEARCKKGLWSVTASTKEQCMHEAKHYFIQYYLDGEYDE